MQVRPLEDKDLRWADYVFYQRCVSRNKLPERCDWMKKMDYPFAFTTEASINLADDLSSRGTRALTPSLWVLKHRTKPASPSASNFQNKDRNLMECVKTIQKSGLQVPGGFILGFNNDPPSIFDRLTRFIQESGIVTAMVGLLERSTRNTVVRTPRPREGRLLNESREITWTCQ